MNTLQQIVEGEPLLHWDSDLSVQNKSLDLQFLKSFGQFGEIASEWLSGLGLQLHRRAVAEDETAEAVPLRLILPALTVGNLVHQQCLHRREWGADRQTHNTFSSWKRPCCLTRGFQRSPNLPTRAGTLSKRKSSIRNPRETSGQVTGVETGA